MEVITAAVQAQQGHLGWPDAVAIVASVLGVVLLLWILMRND